MISKANVIVELIAVIVAVIVTLTNLSFELEFVK